MKANVQQLVEKRNAIVKNWDLNKRSLQRKRSWGIELTAAEWKRWDEIDAFYGKKVAEVDHEIFMAGGMY